MAKQASLKDNHDGKTNKPRQRSTKRSISKDGSKSRVQPLDGKWGWMIVLGASLGHFFLVGLARTIGLFFVNWIDRFEGTAAATAWVQSLFNTIRMVIGPLVSIMVDKFGARPVVMIGGFVFGTGCLISAFATSLQFLYLSFSLLAGLGAGCVFTTMFIMVNQYFNKKKGVAMSLATIGSGLGTIALAPLETFLLNEFGHYGAMMVIGGLMFNCMVVGALFRPIDSKLNWSKQRSVPAQEMQIFIGGDDVDDNGDRDSGKCSLESNNRSGNEATVQVETVPLDNDGRSEEENVRNTSTDDSQQMNKTEESNSDSNKNNNAQLDSLEPDGTSSRKPSPSNSNRSAHSTKSQVSVKQPVIKQVSNTNSHSKVSLKKSSSYASQHQRHFEPEQPLIKPSFKEKFGFLKSITFWVYSFYIAALPCVIQIYVVYTPSIMEERGFSKGQAALVISIAGASDIAGRFIAGFLFDLNFIRTRRWPAHTMYAFCLGVIVLMNAFQHHLMGFIAIALLWGLFEGGYHSQRATIVSEFIKPDQIANSVGFMIFWQGIGNMVSPTFAGFLKDTFGTYSVSFYYGGTTMMFCAVLFFFNYLIVINKKKPKNKKKTKKIVHA